MQTKYVFITINQFTTMMQNYVIEHVVTNFHQELRQLVKQLFDTFK